MHDPMPGAVVGRIRATPIRQPQPGAGLRTDLGVSVESYPERTKRLRQAVQRKARRSETMVEEVGGDAQE
jgi:hypothetical protein